MPVLTPYQRHVSAWRNCDKCVLCNQRSQVVFARGSVPCKVLFVGEAPGQSEDALGQPFVGPAGKLLDHIVGDAWADLTAYQAPGPKVCFYNLVGCFPREAKGTRNHEPPEESIKACGVRLQEFVLNVAKPKLIVCVGQLSESWLEQGYKHSITLPDEIKQAAITHPAAILRIPTAQRELAIRKAVATLVRAVEEMDIPF